MSSSNVTILPASDFPPSLSGGRQIGTVLRQDQLMREHAELRVGVMRTYSPSKLEKEFGLFTLAEKPDYWINNVLIRRFENSIKLEVRTFPPSREVYYWTEDSKALVPRPDFCNDEEAIRSAEEWLSRTPTAEKDYKIALICGGRRLQGIHIVRNTASGKNAKPREKAETMIAALAYCERDRTNDEYARVSQWGTPFRWRWF